MSKCWSTELIFENEIHLFVPLCYFGALLGVWGKISQGIDDGRIWSKSCLQCVNVGHAFSSVFFGKNRELQNAFVLDMLGGQWAGLSSAQLPYL